MSLITTLSSQDVEAQPSRRWREQRGVTLIELLVAMLMALVLSFAAFSILEFASGDVSRITERTHADQTGRVALEKIMLQLHSACVAQEVNPIVEESGPSKIRFVSESGIEPAFKNVHLHEIIYTSASGKTKGALTENVYASTGEEVKGNYPFSKTAESTTKLLTGVAATGTTPIFQYYRYYNSKDKIPTGDKEIPYGEIEPEALSISSKEIAEEVAKVTVSFTLEPEGHESLIAKGHQPVALEDSAIFRLTPSSTTSTHTNSPCSETP